MQDHIGTISELKTTDETRTNFPQENEESKRLEAEVSKLRAELQKLYDTAIPGVRDLIAHGIFSEQRDVNMEKEIQNYKGKKELDPVDEGELRVAESLWSLRRNLESVRANMLDQFPTAKGLYDSKHRLMNEVLERNPTHRNYLKLVKPSENTQNHLLRMKSPVTRDKELTKMLAQLEAISSVLKKISQLHEPRRKLEAEKIAREKAEAERKITQEREAAERRITDRLTNMFGEVRSTITDKLEGDDWESTFDDPREEAIAITMVGNEKQFEHIFSTLFKPELLENPPADIIKTIMASDNVRYLVAHPELMPDVTAPIDPRTAILKRWKEDLRLHEERKKALLVRKNFKAIEKKLLGENKLEDRRSLDSRGEQVMRDITPGKFLEKIMNLAIAEYWREKKVIDLRGAGKFKIRILPVGENVDYWGGIDFVAEFESEKTGQFTLVGVDLTTQGVHNKSATKDTRVLSKPIVFKKEQAEKVFSPGLVRSHPEYLDRTLSLKRTVIFNEMSRRMKSAILENLMERLSNQDAAKIPDDIMRSVYEKSREQGAQKGIITLTIDQLCTALAA